MQNIANALAEVKANAITHAMKKKLEKLLNGGGSSKPKTKPESSDLDDVQGSNSMETESSDVDAVEGKKTIEKESLMESDLQKSDILYGSPSYTDSAGIKSLFLDSSSVEKNPREILSPISKRERRSHQIL